ncbi:hypothetical protein HDV06_001991 [Boothiomyces sp. JEL0866]|nr:hypothetical protein HDV06_001991 [Boothiomyces sp. JEL0866]
MRYKCGLCDAEAFERPKELETHLHVHLPVKVPKDKLKCYKCGLVSRTIKKCQDHEVSHFINAFCCNECGIKYTGIGSLVKHFHAAHHDIHAAITDQSVETQIMVNELNRNADVVKMVRQTLEGELTNEQLMSAIIHRPGDQSIESQPPIFKDTNTIPKSADTNVQPIQVPTSDKSSKGLVNIPPAKPTAVTSYTNFESNKPVQKPIEPDVETNPAMERLLFYESIAQIRSTKKPNIETTTTNNQVKTASAATTPKLVSSVAKGPTKPSPVAAIVKQTPPFVPDTTPVKQANIPNVNPVNNSGIPEKSYKKQSQYIDKSTASAQKGNQVSPANSKPVYPFTQRPDTLQKGSVQAFGLQHGRSTTNQHIKPAPAPTQRQDPFDRAPVQYVRATPTQQVKPAASQITPTSQPMPKPTNMYQSGPNSNHHSEKATPKSQANINSDTMAAQKNNPPASQSKSPPLAWNQSRHNPEKHDYSDKIHKLQTDSTVNKFAARQRLHFNNQPKSNGQSQSSVPSKTHAQLYPSSTPLGHRIERNSSTKYVGNELKRKNEEIETQRKRHFGDDASMFDDLETRTIGPYTVADSIFTDAKSANSGDETLKPYDTEYSNFEYYEKLKQFDRDYPSQNPIHKWPVFMKLVEADGGTLQAIVEKIMSWNTEGMLPIEYEID